MYSSHLGFRCRSRKPITCPSSSFLDPFPPMLASLLHAISSSTQPGKLIFYDTIQSLETEVTNSGINTKSVFISITYLLLPIPLNDFYENPKLHRHQHFKLTCLVLSSVNKNKSVLYCGRHKGLRYKGTSLPRDFGVGEPSHLGICSYLRSLLKPLFCF